jgi:dihydropyrimidine dehydrogenase (NAD+) subunit PreA
LTTISAHSTKSLDGQPKKLLILQNLIHNIRLFSVVDQERCIGCGQCYISCQDGANQAMEFDGLTRKAKVNEERCVGCMLCKHVCPVWDCISHKEVDTKVVKHAAIF